VPRDLDGCDELVEIDVQYPLHADQYAAKSIPGEIVPAVHLSTPSTRAGMWYGARDGRRATGKPRTEQQVATYTLTQVLADCDAFPVTSRADLFAGETRARHRPRNGRGDLAST